MTQLPLWVSLPAAALIIFAGLLAAVGSFGLVRLGDFFARMHPPTMGTTLGAGCLLVASMLVSTSVRGMPVIHELLITLFIVLTAPVNAMLLIRAARYRSARKAALSDGEAADSSSADGADRSDA